MWFAIDTLEYLRRGGRIGGARAWIGSALKIKPILTLEEEITPIERVRTRARSIERLRGYARQRHESGLDAWVVQHIQDPEAATSLADDCREIFGGEPVFISEIGPVIGAHVGPGLLGVGSVSDRSWNSSAAAAKRHQAADRKADHGGADRQLPAGARDLAAPVGQLGDPPAQRFDRAPKSLALSVDVAADLRRRAAGHADRGGTSRLGVGAHLPSPSSIALVSFASSIAWSGTGGAPALTDL